MHPSRAPSVRPCADAGCDAPGQPRSRDQTLTLGRAAASKGFKGSCSVLDCGLPGPWWRFGWSPEKIHVASNGGGPWLVTLF